MTSRSRNAVNKVGNLTCCIILFLNIVFILAMLVIGYGGYFDPIRWPRMSTITLIFPIFPIINFAFLTLWIFIRKKYTLVPIFGLLLCAGPIRDYCPLNIPSDPPQDAIKVLSYNTLSFGHIKDDISPVPILEYVINSDADIVCLQESAASFIPYDILLKRCENYQYSDTAHIGSSNAADLFIMSKMPIVKHQKIAMESVGNGASAFWIQTLKDTIIVINSHLESYSFSDEEKAKYKEILREVKDNDVEKDIFKENAKTIFCKLVKASTTRIKVHPTFRVMRQSCSA